MTRSTKAQYVNNSSEENFHIKVSLLRNDQKNLQEPPGQFILGRMPARGTHLIKYAGETVPLRHHKCQEFNQALNNNYYRKWLNADIFTLIT